MKHILIAAVRGYQRHISPALPRQCRFYPTCSQYCIEALHKYGACKGTWLTIKRLLRCQPLCPGGFDPIP